MAKSFESTHSIKYSAGVAKSRGEKFHYHLHSFPPAAKKRFCSFRFEKEEEIKWKEVLLVVFCLGYALFVLMSLMSGCISGLLNQLCLAESVSVGTKAFSGEDFF